MATNPAVVYIGTFLKHVRKMEMTRVMGKMQAAYQIECMDAWRWTRQQRKYMYVRRRKQIIHTWTAIALFP
jgi:hypothetical protein